MSASMGNRGWGEQIPEEVQSPQRSSSGRRSHVWASPLLCPCLWNLLEASWQCISTFTISSPPAPVKRKGKFTGFADCLSDSFPTPLPLCFLSLGFHGIEAGNPGPISPLLWDQSCPLTSQDTRKYFYLFSPEDILNLFFFPKEPSITLSGSSLFPSPL